MISPATSFFARLLGLLPLFLLLLLCTLVAAPRAMATTYYVSPSGNNQGGLSWQTAWNELDQIQWPSIKPGDLIYLDGGTGSGVTYSTSLYVSASGTPSNPITVKLSSASGHSAHAKIATAESTGVTIYNQTGIVLNGTKQNGIEITTCNGGAYLSQASCTFNFINLHDNSTFGLYLDSGSVNLTNSMVYDNLCTVTGSFSGAASLNVSTCWLYNLASFSGDGIDVSGSVDSGSVTVTNSVLGPGLQTAVSVGGGSGNLLQMTGSLLIDALTSNGTLDLYGNKLNISNCTSYMTALNPQGDAHSCVDVTVEQNSGTVSIDSSIFYGGEVSIPTSVSVSHSKNTHYKTTGNNAAIGGLNADPLFVTNVSNYANNVSYQTLENTNFALQSGSPSKGTGAVVTSVQALKNMWAGGAN